jgi:hypothetical protein
MGGCGMISEDDVTEFFDVVIRLSPYVLMAGLSWFAAFYMHDASLALYSLFFLFAPIIDHVVMHMREQQYKIEAMIDIELLEIEMMLFRAGGK